MLSFNLGPLAISVAHALMLFALITALIAGKVAARRREVPITDTLFNLALAGAVAARLVFVIRYFGEYRPAPLGIFDIRDGGFDAIGGLLGMAAYASFVVWRRPLLRAPLAAALVAGGLAWGLTGGALTLIEQQAASLPEARLQTLDGRATDLATLQAEAEGRPMVVNLWATWCPPCRAEMPVLEAAQNERDDVLFVFANQAEATPTIQGFLDSQDLHIDHVLRDPAGRLAKQAGSAALPTTLFYDGEGRLVDSHLGQLSRATLTAALERFNTGSIASNNDEEQP
ncbi:redoxin domain-containing protein [Salinisphaera dokdonensis CL-ES53]|uniref:Redoxin domain-containing protein n=1 Tax=Salinisphaera dokdonensis CL-ES53 TaxID=1304272 RepID=A0ABV2B4K2_9GAMM